MEDNELLNIVIEKVEKLHKIFNIEITKEEICNYVLWLKEQNLTRSEAIKQIEIKYNERITRNRENKKYQEVKSAYFKIKNILESQGLHIYLCGGLLPYILNDTDSNRLHDDIDTITEIENINKIRTVLKNTEFYLPEFDSINYATNEDYGFELFVEGIPLGIYPFKKELDNKKIIQHSYDCYNKDYKTKTITIENIENYVKEYTDKNGITHKSMALEYLIFTKNMAKREKDLVDIKAAYETGLVEKKEENFELFSETTNKQK